MEYEGKETGLTKRGLRVGATPITRVAAAVVGLSVVASIVTAIVAAVVTTVVAAIVTAVITAIVTTIPTAASSAAKPIVLDERVGISNRMTGY